MRPRIPIHHLSTVHFDIVGSCQLRCVGCPNSTILNKVTRMKPALFAQCVSNIDVESVEIFRFFNYGEPLLHNDLPGIFDAYSEAKRFRVDHAELSTNAQFVRWDQLEDVMRRRVLNRLVVSCDGDGTPASYERHRPPATWDKLIEFLTRAKALRDRCDPNLELMTRTVVFGPADAERWTSVLEPLGWTPEYRGWINLVGGAENLSGRDWEVGSGACAFLSRKRLYVNAEGVVVPCCAHPDAGRLGSLANNLHSEISAGADRRRFVRTLKRDRASLDICKSCEFGSKTDFARYSVMQPDMEFA